MNLPRVSVVLPTRNRLESLRRALNSLDRQTCRDFELLLVDDGSTDGTREFILSGGLQRDYPDIPLINTRCNDGCRGAAASRNRALQQARGEFVAFLDDDDVWLPEYLERQLLCLEVHTEAVASYANYVQLGEDGRQQAADVRPLSKYANPLIQLLTEAFIHSMSVFFCRRGVIESVGLMDEGLKIVHDWEWYLRILLRGETIIALGGPALVIRRGPGGLIAGHREWYREERRVLDRLCGCDPAANQARRHILTHRDLFFARLALRRDDFAFASKRLVTSFARAPVWALRIAMKRLYRNLPSRYLRGPVKKWFGHE